jgi:F-type H+-transporting ATPase subunit gamma
MTDYALKRCQYHVSMGKEVELWGLGTRLNRMLDRRDVGLTYSRPLSTTALPDYTLAHELTMHWLGLYEANELDAVEVVYNQYKGPGIYKQTARRIIPAGVVAMPKLSLKEKRGLWPPPVIESDPVGIYLKVIQQMTTMSFYQALINSAASEHSARFQLMEEATQNSDRLIDEMTELVQMYRRQSITQEMQELAAGAGLVS